MCTSPRTGPVCVCLTSAGRKDHDHRQDHCPVCLGPRAEIGGAWLVWQVVREDRAWWWAGLGVVALGTYGFIAAVIMFAPRPT